MAETLGMLCDKLTIIKLKEYHTTDKNRLDSLTTQSHDLQEEINEYLSGVVGGIIPLEKIRFDSNKVFKPQGNELQVFSGNFGQLMSKLAETNCLLWHEQEKVYDFENVAEADKNTVVKKLAVLNLERNQCIDKINNLLFESISKKK